MVGRLTAEWRAEHDRWQERDLSARRYVYLWANGVYLQVRMEDHAECMLVLIGATPEGRKELVGFQIGVRESAQSCRELLVDVKRRGLAIAPEIDQGDHGRDRRSSSAVAKYALAWRGISFAWRNSRTSRSNALMRSRPSGRPARPYRFRPA